MDLTCLGFYDDFYGTVMSSVGDIYFFVLSFQNEKKELEEKFRKAMVANAGLDNEKSQLIYQVLICCSQAFSKARVLFKTFLMQVELLKDQLEESEEQQSIVTKELREKNREFQLLKRSHAETQRAVQLLQVSVCRPLLFFFIFRPPGRSIIGTGSLAAI